MVKIIKYRRQYRIKFTKLINQKRYEDLEKLWFDNMLNNPDKKTRQHAQFFYGYALSILDKLDLYEQYLETTDVSTSSYKDSQTIRKIYFHLFQHEFDKALILLNELSSNKKIKKAYLFALELYECYLHNKKITNKFLLKALPNSLVPFHKKMFIEIMENNEK